MQSAPGRSHQLRRTRLIAFALLMFPLAVRGQNSTSTLRGVVQDPSARRVVGAQVVVRLRGSGSSIAREATANDRGEFRIDGLLPGPYQVAVTAKGFAEASADVDTAVSVVRDITITLKPAAAHETVNVPGNVSSITTETLDTSSAVRGGVVDSKDLESFPLPARSFANIAYLVPALSRSSLPILRRRASPPFHRRKLRLEQRTVG